MNTKTFVLAMTTLATLVCGSQAGVLSAQQKHVCSKARFNEKTCHYGSIILAVGVQQRVTWREGVAAIAAAMTETNGPNQPYPAKISNPGYGDQTSVGLFQILNIHGSYAQRMNPWWSSRWWFRQARSARVVRKAPAVMAQAVEQSAYPSRYRSQVGDATILAYALGYRSVDGRLRRVK